MPEPITFGYVGYPFPEPTCCPDAYQCDGEIECDRHGGFDVCCDRPEEHIPQDRNGWHEQMARWEQRLLDRYVQRLPFVEDSGYKPSDPAFAVLLVDNF
ncbi:hypothetical protein [Streptomyces sp. NPDC088752]|uniref:hypothetical protein n=1 Tax=Streptomyces sp. NPDC088752 TaxID=3154963 RepID=UPI0034340030